MKLSTSQELLKLLQRKLWLLRRRRTFCNIFRLSSKDFIYFRKIIHLPHNQIYGERRQNATYSNQAVTNMVAQNNQNTIIDNRPPIITQNQQIIQTSTLNNQAINNQRIVHQPHQFQNTQVHQTNHIISRSTNPQIKINGIVKSSQNQTAITKQ